MCMVDDAEMVNILSDVDRVARKEHRCGECGRMIQRGETYKAEAGVIDGRMDVYKTCAHCLVVREWLSGECGGWVYTATDEDMVEHCNGYGHPMSVYRLAVGQRRKREGWVQLNVWVKREWVSRVRKYVANLVKGEK